MQWEVASETWRATSGRMPSEGYDMGSVTLVHKGTSTSAQRHVHSGLYTYTCMHAYIPPHQACMHPAVSVPTPAGIHTSTRPHSYMTHALTSTRRLERYKTDEMKRVLSDIKHRLSSWGSANAGAAAGGTLGVAPPLQHASASASYLTEQASVGAGRHPNRQPQTFPTTLATITLYAAGASICHS